MAQIINSPDLSALTGQALGTGLSNLLTGLAQSKAQDIARQRTAQGLGAIPGITREQAQSFSSLDPQVLGPVLKELINQPRRAATGKAVSEILNQLSNRQPDQFGETGTPTTSSISNKPIDLGELGGKEALDIANLALKAKKQQAAERGEERASAKDVREFVAPYSKMAEGAEDRIRNYNLAIKGAQSGNIRPGYVNQLLDKMGLHGLGQNPTQAVLDKSLNTLGLDAASAFGSGTRLTNYLEQIFQRTLPNLHNEPAAIVGISKIKILEEEMKKLPEEAIKDLVKEWKGRIPGDAELQLRDRIKDRKQEIEQQVYREADNLNALASGLGEEQDTLPAPEVNVKYYVSDLGTNVSSPDGKSYIREDNGQPFDWQAYNKGVR